MKATLIKGKREVTVYVSSHPDNVGAPPKGYFDVVLPYTERELANRRPGNSCGGHLLRVHGSNLDFKAEGRASSPREQI